MNGIQPSLYGEMFPTRVRLSGTAIGTQIGFAIGGFAPTAAAAIEGDGPNGWVPVAAYVLVSSLIAAVALSDGARNLPRAAARDRRPHRAVPARPVAARREPARERVAERVSEAGSAPASPDRDYAEEVVPAEPLGAVDPLGAERARSGAARAPVDPVGGAPPGPPCSTPVTCEGPC